MHELDTGLAEIQTRSTRSLAAETNRSLLETRQTEVGSLLSPLPYYPMLTLYIRKNKGRILLKVNKK